MSTTVGETGADYLAVHVGLGTAITGGIMVGLLATVLLLQLRMRRYVPWIYWLTVVLASVVGTQITDTLTDRLEISLCVSTAAFAAALARGPASARRAISTMDLASWLGSLGRLGWVIGLPPPPWRSISFVPHGPL